MAMDPVKKLPTKSPGRRLNTSTEKATMIDGIKNTHPEQDDLLCPNPSGGWFPSFCFRILFVCHLKFFSALAMTMLSEIFSFVMCVKLDYMALIGIWSLTVAKP